MTWKNETTGQRLPAPLPMYEPVRLKHVPTFVRRRYDRDIKAIHDANKEESRSDGDGVEDDDPISVVTDVDDGVDNDEVEADAHANFGSYSKDFEEEDDGAKDVEYVSSMDASIENDLIDNEQGLNYKDKEVEVDECEDATLIDNVDASVKDEVQDNEKGFHEQHNKSEDGIVGTSYENGTVEGVVNNNEYKDGISDDEQGMQIIIQCPGDSASYADASVEAKDGVVTICYENGSVDQDVVQDNKHGNFDNEQDLVEEDNKSEGHDEVEDVSNDAAAPDNDSVDDAEEDDVEVKFDTKHDTQTYTTENVDNYNLESSASIYSEENKCEAELQHKDGASSVEASVEDGMGDHGHENLNINDQGSHSRALEEEEEEDRAKDVNLEGYGDTSVNNGAQHKERGLHMEDCETELDGIINANTIEFKDIEHGNYDNMQGVDLNVDDCKRVEDGSNKDVVVAYNYLDETFKLREITEKHENLDTKQDFIPEAFVKTLERDGYELCCPNCKHIITRTMIIRRKEDCQQCNTTCITFLTSLFCCNRW